MRDAPKVLRHGKAPEENLPEHTVFAVWHDAQSRVHGVFASHAAAQEYASRCDDGPGLTIVSIHPEHTAALFLNPLKCLRQHATRTLPPVGPETVYTSELERWLWGNTRTRQHLADYLDAVGDADGVALDVHDELRIARRALKFAAARLLAGIVD